MNNIKTFDQLFEAAKQPTVKFMQWTCHVNKAEYENGRTALELINAKNGEDVLVATVNIPEEKIAPDEVIIKDYSENEGILQVLVNAKIISEPIRTVHTGFVECPVCKLLI
jgi:hypothetical protein